MLAKLGIIQLEVFLTPAIHVHGETLVYETDQYDTEHILD
jgi:hypothetical protein